MSLLRFNSAKEWIEQFGETRKPTVVTIGNFDGMHLGHQEILKHVLHRAHRGEYVAAVLTFFPHPVRILRPADAPPLLMTLEQRLAAFALAGIDAALVLPFNEALSKMSPEGFVEKYLVEAMRAESVLVGENFRFGHRQQGNVNTLQSLAEGFGFEVEIVASLAINETVVSSTAVRACIGDGRMEQAARMLGQPFALSGCVIPGSGQGRKLVVPTLNLETQQEMLPRTGVYITETILGESTFPSVTNVGRRPTFNGSRVTIESHLFEFGRQLTFGQMTVRFLSRLRDEMKFSGPSLLREQVLKDIESAKEFHRVRKR